MELTDKIIEECIETVKESEVAEYKERCKQYETKNTTTE